MADCDREQGSDKRGCSGILRRWMRRECGFIYPRNYRGADDYCYSDDDYCYSADDYCYSDDDCGADDYCYSDDDCGADDYCYSDDDYCWAAFVAKRCWFQPLRRTGPGVRGSRWMDPSASRRIPLVRNPTHIRPVGLGSDRLARQHLARPSTGDSWHSLALRPMGSGELPCERPRGPAGTPQIANQVVCSLR